MPQLSAEEAAPQRSGKRHQGTFALVAVVVLALLLGASTWLTHSAARDRNAASARELLSREISDELAMLREATFFTARQERSFMLTNDASLLPSYREGRDEIMHHLALLRPLVAEDPEQRRVMAGLAQRLEDQVTTMDRLVALQSAGRRDEALDLIRTGDTRRTLDRLLSDLSEFDVSLRENLEQRRRLSEVASRRAERLTDLLAVISFVLLACGFYAALALRRSQKREAEYQSELYRKATTDELTGLANRRELLNTLERTMAWSRRSARPMALAIFDIDHFKRVNDTLGHPAGDEVLCHIAELALKTMRKQDMVGRLGGEEFVIVMPDCGAQQAMIACERLRQAVASTPVFLASGTSLNVTLSTGVTQLHINDDRTGLIARADEALYRAKKEGRDKVLLSA